MTYQNTLTLGGMRRDAPGVCPERLYGIVGVLPQSHLNDVEMPGSMPSRKLYDAVVFEVQYHRYRFWNMKW